MIISSWSIPMGDVLLFGVETEMGKIIYYLDIEQNTLNL